MTPEDIRARLAALQADDLPVHGGRTLAYVYDAGLAEVDALAREAVAAFAGSNGLDPTAFPSLLAMENDLVAFARALVDGPETMVGTLTSGGTESCLLAVQGARDARPDVRDPSIVVADTVHAAFHKAGHYFGVRVVVVPVGPDHRADAAAMAAAIDDTTVLVVASAPSYADGVVDPVPAVAAAAAARGVRCHVDACIGGWVLPYAARLGRPVTPWTFAVEGVTSISTDLHKYAYAPKGASLLLHRDPSLRRPQYFAHAGWPGYTMLNATLQSTRSGGPTAGAWATVQAIGDAGYLRLTEQALVATDAIAAGISALPGLSLVASPESTLVAAVAAAGLDVFTVCDEMAARGWFVQPQLSYGDRPPSLHVAISAATDAEAFLAALRSSVEAAREAGPVPVDPGVAELLRSLDPATLGDAEFDLLLAAGGLAGDDGDLGLPERMAPVNALLDVAPPALREAVLVAFLDRLARPGAGSFAPGT
ncbi:MULTISPECIES: aminotransferase class V-fold PLP-dependent enzyme [unclassified Nocardioides]|uniref:pyridoxal phosphate-dependent decarboxylase family protein n=1 Tax=unclassified Nocardioides TaxID=2615069 RepID=UPI00116D8505|nr:MULTISPECIES: aminotransferase class V-fold PLP-dependent enzyme [unclassified Nocardioides]TQK72490.1 glutamate/tyrosine decarboxylase-like PLP-dependent enzyme [Nocardioides sp. SLBN-35]WGY03305.1 aminotransferase class V-fold PLP-dependent enzyme [Nocardioides sp. QY071]